jgi:formamidopyrimidine-DNA glycosylase
MPFAAMGPEPLGNGFNGEILLERLKGRKGPIKSALLDQHVVAGLGNIYVCEALFRARISPFRIAGMVSAAECEALALEIRGVLQDALASGGSSLRDYRKADGGMGYFQHHFDVYGREGEVCGKCAAPVERVVQSGRSTFFCSVCQR